MPPQVRGVDTPSVRCEFVVGGELLEVDVGVASVERVVVVDELASLGTGLVPLGGLAGVWLIDLQSNFFGHVLWLCIASLEIGF